MKGLAGKLQPGISMLFVLFRKVTWEKVLPRISLYGGNHRRDSRRAASHKRFVECDFLRSVYYSLPLGRKSQRLHSAKINAGLPEIRHAVVVSRLKSQRLKIS
jgi:hypothetical protein